MRAPFAALIAVMAAGVVARADTQEKADPRVTLGEVTLRKHPGENQDAVATYAAGVTVKVLVIQGRWVKVQIDKSVGWVPRTKLSEPSAPPAPEPAATGRSRQLSVEVRGADAVVRAEPASGAASVAPVAVGARLAVIPGAAPGWLHVDDGHGHVGWIEAAAVGDPGAAAASTAPTKAGAPARDVGPARAVTAGAWTLHATAAVGYRSLDQRFTSNATGGLANYSVSADASVAELGLAATPRLGRGAVRLGADARARFTSSSPGIDYPGPTLAPGTIPFTMFEGAGAVHAGYRLGPVVPQLRVGGYYGAFLADDVANAGRMPREALWAVFTGLGVEVVPPRSRVRLEARADLAVAGGRRQTPGLADGMTSDAGAAWLELRLAYTVAAHVAVFAGISYDRYATDWSGASERWADVTSAQRIDHAQLIEIGIGAGR
ncbi:MAG: SH3 domain-containing protein [Myxococcales bacterium]|nr:SH3 domain-containing protein [Myxococcales bacterium]